MPIVTISIALRAITGKTMQPSEDAFGRRNFRIRAAYSVEMAILG
jgi:hypothetical protein